jgi:RHS repeat-associated protein
VTSRLKSDDKATGSAETSGENTVKILSAYPAGSYYIYSFDGKLMAEYNLTGQLVRDYIYIGNQLVAEYQEGPTYYYYASDQINSTRVVMDGSGNVAYSAAYDPFGGIQKTWEPTTYTPTMKFSGKERDEESQLDYFGGRYYARFNYRFLSVDPIINKQEALTNPQLWNLYSFCRNNPVTYYDPDGGKDLPFNSAKDLRVSPIKGTATPMQFIGGRYNKGAYNCHSYAWHDSKGDPTDPRNADLVAVGVRKWDNNPDDDIFAQGYFSLDPNAPNKPGDRVIYYVDSNGNGQYDKGEYMDHSAIVHDVDSQGNTTSVIGKMGQGAISINHPDAPGYYQKTKTGEKTSRNYFRKFQGNVP